MSDVSAAPAAPAAAPAPVHGGEVPINPSPVAIPQPVGPQAPSRPVGDQGSPHRPESRREALRASFAKVRDRETPPAKAAMGHNQPPEAMQREKPKAPPPEHSDRRAGPNSRAFDLRKRPEDQQPMGRRQRERQEQERQRGEHGHFAPRAPQAGQQSGQQFNQFQPIPTNSNQAASQAPPRMSQQAQAEWQHTPPSVRHEVHRMQHELGHAFRSLWADHQAMNEIRPYHDLARSQGTTLARAIGNYWGMEQKLRSDPIGALDTIVNNMNLRTPQGRIGLRDIAWHVLNLTPDQHRATQFANAQTAQQMRLAELERQQQALAQQNHRMQYEQAFRRTRGEVDRYAATHPRLDELGAVIEQELKLGFDLDTAYRRADRLYPAGSASPGQAQWYQGYAPQGRNQAAPTRTPDRSIHGAPDNGPQQRTFGRRSDSKPVGRREAIAAAMRRVNGSL